MTLKRKRENFTQIHTHLGHGIIICVCVCVCVPHDLIRSRRTRHQLFIWLSVNWSVTAFDEDVRYRRPVVWQCQSHWINFILPSHPSSTILNLPKGVRTRSTGERTTDARIAHPNLLAHVQLQKRRGGTRQKWLHPAQDGATRKWLASTHGSVSVCSRRLIRSARRLYTRCCCFFGCGKTTMVHSTAV